MSFTERPFARIAATWLALAAALLIALPWPVSPGLYAVGCAVGLALCALGFHAADRARGPLPDRAPPERLKLGGLALASGAALGGALLGLLWLLARGEPDLRARFAGRLDEPRWRPWALAFESSILEKSSFDSSC